VSESVDRITLTPHQSRSLARLREDFDIETASLAEMHNRATEWNILANATDPNGDKRSVREQWLTMLADYKGGEIDKRSHYRRLISALQSEVNLERFTAVAFTESG
jgi:hypothetical protein